MLKRPNAKLIVQRFVDAGLGSPLPNPVAEGIAAVRMTPTGDVISVESVDTSPGTALTNLNPNGVTSALPAQEVPETLEMTPALGLAISEDAN